MKLQSLTCIIPTFNNEETIETVIEKVNDIGMLAAKSFSLIVCNDGSFDETASILKNLQKKYANLRVITHTVNKGYGLTIKELYYEAKGEWLFSVPGDFQIDPKELEKLLPHAGHADMILGWRVSRHDPKERLVQSSVYNQLLRLLFGISIHDVNTVRLMKTSILQSIHLQSSSAFVDAELVIQAIRNGYIVKEIPIDHKRDDQKGSGGHLGTILSTIAETILFRFGL